MTYADQEKMVCTQCYHEWKIEEEVVEREVVVKVLDANGNQLVDGDTVVVVKDLPVKGYLRPVKIGTKVKNIHLTSGDHNISCKIEGFGSMALKSEYVRKA